MNPLQNNIDNNIHESNITGFINNNFSQTTATTATQVDNNCDNPSCSCNNGIAVLNNDFSAITSFFTDRNNYQQFTPNSTSNNNDDIISSDHNYQQPIFNDALNNNVGHSYHQTTSNNESPPQFFSQYNDQNLSQTTSNVFPLLNSLGITIYSPRTNIIITPLSSSDIRNLIQ
ncbi:hypothetical protein RclHR1_21890001 [Rhizophagus clarus]|uniref:Uncharacterized protein n=1 Tax=Rhizophagus clarus TaxID=94130 RepID=A0A2Z6QVB3_9GLOM|nr:hypothetical protein RclHR1_21890001 [Rhizophagus clarus]GES98202.1 hypothetical protein GLOIN_2v1761180 [Rhizophagus clarus]